MCSFEKAIWSSSSYKKTFNEEREWKVKSFNDDDVKQLICECGYFHFYFVRMMIAFKMIKEFRQFLFHHVNYLSYYLFLIQLNIFMHDTRHVIMNMFCLTMT